MIGNDAGSCPCCGALPIDWVDNPFKAPASPGVLVEALRASLESNIGVGTVDARIRSAIIDNVLAATRQTLSTTTTPASDGVACPFCTGASGYVGEPEDTFCERHLRLYRKASAA